MKVRRMRDGSDAEFLRFMKDISSALDVMGVARGEEFWIATTPPEAHARRTDPTTSRAAAASVNDLRESQMSVLRAFHTWGPMTDEELVRRYEEAAASSIVPQQSPSGIRSRRSELARGGLLRDSGQTKPLSSGRQAIIWTLPPAREPEPAPEPEPEPAASLFDIPAAASRGPYDMENR